MIDQELQTWLTRIEQQHPVEIELGLSRISKVAKEIGILEISTPLITVAGTNGKGSVVAFLTALYIEAGFNVGAYTSPHICQFNERIKINANMVNDQAIVAAFEHIDVVREDVSLSYFEFATLAAMKIFLDDKVDVILMEVGLGGRLDAVNSWDADVAVVTAIEVDHRAWLGENREIIAPEKTGIARSGRPLIVGDREAPQSLFDTAERIGADVICIQKDFDYSKCGSFWNLNLKSTQYNDIPAPVLKGSWQYDNASVAIAAAEALVKTLPFNVDALRRSMNKVSLEGRFDQRKCRGKEVIFDVSHNPAAIRSLVQQIGTTYDEPVKAVFAVMHDKAVDEMIEIASPYVDTWYLGDLGVTRAMPSSELVKKIKRINSSQKVISCIDVNDAFDLAIKDSGLAQPILVFGSFLTVASVMRHVN